jgi:ubiquinone/menaquinone biosynthesis C-methylase UbiE
MSSQKSAVQFQPSEVKQCCAHLYESDMAKLLLGDSFHPGGVKLTERLGGLLQLTPKSRVLDVASGRGTSAMFLAERFGCEVIGIDFSERNVEEASGEATVRGLGRQVSFQHADAESLPFADRSFDAVVCECAFCTFPDKSLVAHQFARVLRSGGRVGLSDLTRGYEIPKELAGLLAWIACIADAQPVENYIEWFRAAGLVPEHSESHDQVLAEMVRQVQAKLLGAEIMAGLKRIELPGLDLSSAKQMAKAGLDAVQQGQLGYAIVIAGKAAIR